MNAIIKNNNKNTMYLNEFLEEKQIQNCLPQEKVNLKIIVWLEEWNNFLWV